MAFISNKRNPSVTTGKLWSNIWQISWPMLLIMILQFLVGITDIYVAGLISSEVQAAVGFISQLYFLVIIIGNAISIGTVSLVSKAVGAGNVPHALWNAKQSMLFGFLISVALALIIGLFFRQIITATGFPVEIRSIAEIFLQIFTVALVPNYLLVISNAVFRAGGAVKIPLLSMFVFCIVNVLGDFGFVFGRFGLPLLGFSGIAVATAVAATIGMIVNLVFMIRLPWRGLYMSSWRIRWRAVQIIVRLSWPAAMLQIAWNAGSIVLYNILGRLGESSITALAAITNGLRIEAIIFLPAFAFNMAASVLVGQNLGAGRAERAERIGWQIAIVGMIFVSVMAAVIFVGAEYCAAFFTADRAVLEETTRYLRINMFSEPFMALSLVLVGGLQGAGDTRGTMWVIVVAMWLIRLPLAYGLVFLAGFGATGAWIAMVSSMIMQGLLMARRFRSGYWKTITVH